MFLVIDWVWQFLLQEDKQRMGVFAIHRDFTEQINLGYEPVPRPYILQGIENLTVVAVLLVTELIAGKTQNSEPLSTVLIHELVHLENKKIHVNTNERQKSYSGELQQSTCKIMKAMLVLEHSVLSCGETFKMSLNYEEFRARYHIHLLPTGHSRGY